MKKKYHLFLFPLSLLVLFFCVQSCGSTSQSTSKKVKGVWETNDVIYQDETYSSISGNVQRLYAMLCGKFIHYNRSNPKRELKAWTVNGGKDSVMVYIMPVGDPNKVGHWLYYYQIMTSLPDEPIYEAFSKLEVVDRDTIRSVYYDAPTNFNVPLEELVSNPKAAFAQVKLGELSLSSYGEVVTYVRKTPLHFEGKSRLMQDHQNEHLLRIEKYGIKPQGHSYQSLRYNKEKELVNDDSENSYERFVKKATLKALIPNQK